MNTKTPIIPQRHRQLSKIARQVTSKFRAALWDANMKRRVGAVLNARLREFIAAGEVEPGWVAVIIQTNVGADVQYTRAA